MGLFNFRSKKTAGDADPGTAVDAVTAPAPAVEPAGAETPAGGWLARLRARLNRGDSWLTYDLANLPPGSRLARS